MPDVILPGIYITVRDEGLITVGGVSTGNIGIVGAAVEGNADKVYTQPFTHNFIHPRCKPLCWPLRLWQTL